jgi:branched-subunit amino acid transport protein
MSGPSTPGLLAAVAVLSAGTFAYRIAGPALKAKVTLTERTRRLTDTATVVLLTALVATAALLQAGSPAGTARPLGVLVAGVLAWRRAPFLVVVIAAAATTAVLRLAFGLR